MLIINEGYIKTNFNGSYKIFLFIKLNRSLILCVTPHDSDEVRVPEADSHELLLRDVTLVIDINLAEQNLRLPYTFLLGQILDLKIRFVCKYDAHYNTLKLITVL